MGKGPALLPVNEAPPLGHLADDPIWRATFRGYFWGEGSLMISRINLRRNGKTTLYHRAEFNLSQANSNKAAVMYIKDVLGGTVYSRGVGNSKGMTHDSPTWVWMLRSNQLAGKVLSILEEERLFPDKKAGKVSAMRQFLDLVYELDGAKRSPDVLQRMEELACIVSPRGPKAAVEK